MGVGEARRLGHRGNPTSLMAELTRIFFQTSALGKGLKYSDFSDSLPRTGLT